MSGEQSEGSMQYAIALSYGNKYCVIPNLNFGFMNPYVPRPVTMLNQLAQWPLHAIQHEADLLFVDLAGKNTTLWEIEVKISYADFKRDFDKQERHMTPYTRYIYYAFPQKLLERRADDINSMLDEKAPYAGIIAVRDKEWVWHDRKEAVIVRRAKKLETKEMPIQVEEAILRIGCMKWWR